MADIESVAKQFADFYYNAFDTNRAGLQALYVRHPLVLLILISADLSC
jgi:hypothetical protein